MPSVVSRILNLKKGVHKHLTAAVLAEMQDVRGSACFENSETEFRCLRCNVLWKAEEKWKDRGWDLFFGGANDNEYALRGMMGRQLLAILRQQRATGMHGERRHRRAARLGHGTQAGIAVIEEHL